VADPHGQTEPSPGALSARQIELMVRDLESLPTLPSSARRFAELLRGTCPPELVVEALSCDASAAARLLSLASAAGARTVRQAVDALGTDAVRSAVLSLGVFAPAEPDGGLDPVGFWRHCLAVACAAEMIAEKAHPLLEPAEAFAAGLLHDLGKLLLHVCVPKSYARAAAAAGLHQGNIAEYERSILGVDHCAAGRRLAERWRLPEAVRDAIWLHHQPVEAIPEAVASRRLIGIVSLADALAIQEGLGSSCNYSPARRGADLAARITVSETVVRDVVRRLAGLARWRGELLGLDELPSDGASRQSLWRQTIETANAELGGLDAQRREREKELRAGAEAFNCLSGFLESLSPSAGVFDVLQGAVQAASTALGLEGCDEGCVTAYAPGPDGSEVLAVRRRAGARECRTFPARRQAAQEPPPPVREMEALLEDAEPFRLWAELDSCSHLTLLCDGRWAGGLLYPSGPGPAPVRALEALGGAAEFVLELVRRRARAEVMSEQFAAASQLLAAMQESLAEARTLAAAGEMAAGAAHEINNPLAVVSGRAQLMREKARTEEERRTWQLIADQAQRISDIVTELVEVASPPAPRPGAIAPARLLEGAANAFSSSDHPQASAAQVDIRVSADVPPAWADASQIHWVVLELITNAATAAGPSPRIRLAAQPDELHEALLLTVQDNGPGMDERVLQRAYTPFFSHQPSGRRRGLGLSRAKRYVEINGGRMWIRSKAGEGTCVYVQLPAAGRRLESEGVSDGRQ